MESDAALLQRYAHRQDANAFAEMVRRYSGYVFGVSLRVTGNPHDAEDVTQECFMSLARNAGSIRSSLAGWLHSAATSRGANLRRGTGRRQRREAEAAAGQAPEPTWAELAPHVDEALESIPEPLRVPLILHYIQGRSQDEIALELGLSQSTVSRRLEKGLEVLRGKLKAAGVVASAALVASLLTANTASAAPVGLAAALGKMTMAGVGASSATGTSAAAGTATATAAGPGIVKAAAIMAVAAGGIIAGGVILHGAASDPAPLPLPPAPVPAAQVEAPLPAADRVWVEVEGLEAHFEFQRETVLTAPDDWLYIGGDLYWCYGGGQGLHFSHEGARVLLAMDGGEPRLIGVRIRTPLDVAEAQRVLAEARGPLTVWCECPVVGQLTGLPGAENIASLCVSGEALASDLSPLARFKNLTSLCFGSGAGHVADLEPLTNLKSLRSLSLSRLDPAARLSPLARLPTLRSLDLSGSSGLSDLSVLAGLHSLTSLDLRYCPEVSNLSALSGLRRLTYLNLERCDGLRDVSPLAQLTDLQELNLGGCTVLSGVSALARLSTLRSLTAPATATEADLRTIANGCRELEFLGLTGWRGMCDLSVAGEFGKLKSLHLGKGSPGLPEVMIELAPIADLTGLRELVVSNCVQVSGLSSLTGLKELTSLEISWCPEFSDLSGLSELKGLKRLSLAGCGSVTDLSPITQLTGLQELALPPLTTNEDLAALLPKLPSLTSLSMGAQAIWLPDAPLKRISSNGASLIWDLSPLANLTGLEGLDMNSCISVYDLGPLASLPRLRLLSLLGCESLTDLSPIHAIIRRNGSVAVEPGLQAQLETLKTMPAAANGTGASGTAPRREGSPRHPTRSPEELQRAATVAKEFGYAVPLVLQPMDRIAFMERFYDAYRLKPGENFKLLVPAWPERPALFPDWDDHDPLPVMLLPWQDPCLKMTKMWPDTHGQVPLSQLLKRILELGSQEIEGRDDALQRILSCDAVFRVGVAPEVMVKDIEQELRKKLNWPVRLSFRDVNRKAVTVSAAYRYSPLPGLKDIPSDEIEIYGSQPREDPGRLGEGCWSGSFTEFLREVGDYVGLPVVSDARGPIGRIGWLEGPLPLGVLRGQLPDGEIALVLQHLSEQTGLSLKEEERQVRILYVDLDLPPGAAW